MILIFCEEKIECLKKFWMLELDEKFILEHGTRRMELMEHKNQKLR